ncbi:DUF971 domain-containing protein [Marinimicrobium sp. ABcell2]|uniref:DUF971 domain-containing protein n=1 Tax=Marinimicrobium sp. ABcell2 TaxID=3069751 RepID=UPI0027AFEDC4|nr:DUF971 domain-containing protein [Marinimicrobium sp. ABcell2]MDQ2078036.1 DUF971 domain-containing protein [Marinimicrobium sp. ABcell2]
MNRETFQPAQIQHRRKEGVVTIVWRHGETSSITGEDLRRYCACSECRAKEKIGLRKTGEANDVVRLELMGTTGMQVVFADGHDRGIYPWEYLYRIGQDEAMEYLYA